MPEFLIEPQRVNSNSEDMKGYSRKIGEFGTDLESIKNNMGVSYLNLRSALDTIHNDILKEALNMDSLGKAFAMILQAYVSAEGTITNDGQDKRRWYQRILGELGLGDERYADPAYHSTTKEQEEAWDNEMRRLTDELLNDSRFSEDTWNNANMDERKQMLKDFMDEIAVIYGIEVAENINFTNKPGENGGYNLGSYQHSGRQVSINEWAMDDNNVRNTYRLMETISHELRHAYQSQAVDHPERFQVTQQTIDIWETNSNNYIGSNGRFDLYQEQPIEKDARWMSGNP